MLVIIENMNKLLLFVLIPFSFISTSKSQDSIVQINGYVYQQGHKEAGIENAQVIVLHKLDTIAQFTTDSLGNYGGKVKIALGDYYKMNISHKYCFENNSDFRIQFPQSKLVVEHSLLTKMIHSGPTIYEFNQVEMTEELDFEYLQFQSRSLAHICLRFIHYKLPEESNQIALQRMTYFTMKMLENGFTHNQFSIVLRTLDCKTTRVCKATIEGSLESVANNCD